MATVSEAQEGFIIDLCTLIPSPLKLQSVEPGVGEKSMSDD